jgi:hypothetical protein
MPKGVTLGSSHSYIGFQGVRPFFAPSVWYKNIVSTISSNVAVFLTNAHFFLVSSPINCLLNRSLQPWLSFTIVLCLTSWIQNYSTTKRFTLDNCSCAASVERLCSTPYQIHATYQQLLMYGLWNACAICGILTYTLGHRL